MDFVSDTNVWYDIGNGQIDPARIKQGGVNRLLATAINALEISSRINDRNFDERKRAAQAVLEHADEHLKDPERHMADIWGLAVTDLKLDWQDVYRTIAASKDIDAMNGGTERIIKINTSAAEAWREGFTEKFVEDTESAIRTRVPKYALRRNEGKMRYLVNPAEIADFEADLFSDHVRASQVLLTRTRASDHAPVPPPQPTDEELKQEANKLKPFVEANLTLIFKAATLFAVYPNDWGDLHCFVYLQDGRKLLTGEKKWLSIAEDAGLGHLVEPSGNYQFSNADLR